MTGVAKNAGKRLKVQYLSYTRFQIIQTKLTVIRCVKSNNEVTYTMLLHC